MEIIKCKRCGSRMDKEEMIDTITGITIGYKLTCQNKSCSLIFYINATDYHSLEEPKQRKEAK